MMHMGDDFSRLHSFDKPPRLDSGSPNGIDHHLGSEFSLVYKMSRGNEKLIKVSDTKECPQ